MIPSAYYRSLLSPDEQDSYKKIVNALLHYHEKVQINVGFHETEAIRRIVKAVHMDHPEMIHVNFWHFHILSNPMFPGSTIRFDFLLNETTFRSVTKTIQRKVDTIRPKLSFDMSPKKSYIILIDEIAKSTSYKNTNSAFWDHTAAGPLLLHSAVCEGIAKLYLLLCQRFNLPCALITGDLNGEPHAWNMVEIDGNRKYVDVTGEISIRKEKNFLPLFSGALKNKQHMLISGYSWRETI